MNCLICNIPTSKVLEGRILGKYTVDYFKCPECEIIKPENPHWLAESYSSAIAATDVGLVSRNLYHADVVNAILARLQDPAKQVLDVGGGYGLLCRILRDRGWDCYTMDSYCENMLARNFDAPEGMQADTLLAFEVFEHIEDPMEFVRSKVKEHGAKLFVFSTLTHSWDVPPKDWSYYAFETGQHISLYKRATLSAIAKQIGWHYIPLTDGLHMFCKEKPDFIDELLLTKRMRIISRLYRFYAGFMRRSNRRLMEDYEQIKAGVKRSQSRNQTEE